MEDFSARESRIDSRISEFAKDKSNEPAIPEVSSSQGTQAMESAPSDWTDEKHNMFLESIEASFVSQLFGSSSPEENISRPNLHGQSKCDSHTHFGKFKVLRHGSWKSINFEEIEPRMKVLNDSQALSRNPWIHHFRASHKHKNVACTKIEAINSRGRNTSPFGSTNNSRPQRACNSHLSQQYVISSNTEMSGQNFVDEDSDVEKESRVRNAKRVKTPVTNVSSNDQVVPSSKCRERDDVNKTTRR